jgi:hypothetical protein
MKRTAEKTAAGEWKRCIMRSFTGFSFLHTFVRLRKSDNACRECRTLEAADKYTVLIGKSEGKPD